MGELIVVNNNKLVTGEPRIGWYSDGLPDDVTPPTATMLRDDGKRISLTLPWKSGIPTSQVERWFRGQGTHFSDDPDRTKYRYEVPQQLLFIDVDGPVALVGCRAAGYRSKWGRDVIGHGIIDVKLAVIGGRNLRYDRINGLRTVIPELASWMGLTSLKEEAEYSEENRLRKLNVVLESPDTIELAPNLNISIVPTWRVDRAEADGPRQFHDEAYIQTLVTRPRAWSDHFDAHQSVRELLDIAAWQPFGYRRITAQRSDDPARYLNGEVASEKWCDTRTYSVREAEPQSKKPQYIFGFRDINGARGFRRWIKLRAKYERATVPILALLDLKQSHIETQLTQSSIGLEALGYQLALDSGMPNNQASGLPLHERFQLIQSSLSVNILDGDWPTRSAGAYNGLKHANRALPDPGVMIDVVRQNIIAFRIWAATRLGVNPSILRRRLAADPIIRHLVMQGLASEP